MSKVFFSVSVSLDGYLVPPGMDLEHAGDPKHEDWGAVGQAPALAPRDAILPEEPRDSATTATLASTTRSPSARSSAPA